MQAMNQTYLSVIGIGLALLGLGAAGWALWMVRGLNTLRKNFFTGSNAKDLESVINQLAEGLHTLQKNQVILENYIKTLRSDFHLAAQKVGLVRFNPFSDGGGNFSFCLAVLDGHNTGFVLTSMHGREQNRIYTKQIVQGKCDIQLTEEELKAIEQANNQHQKLISK
jgi:hypothetical protein